MRKGSCTVHNVCCHVCHNTLSSLRGLPAMDGGLDMKSCDSGQENDALDTEKHFNNKGVLLWRR